MLRIHCVALDVQLSLTAQAHDEWQLHHAQMTRTRPWQVIVSTTAGCSRGRGLDCLDRCSWETIRARLTSQLSSGFLVVDRWMDWFDERYTIGGGSGGCNETAKQRQRHCDTPDLDPRIANARS